MESDITQKFRIGEIDNDSLEIKKCICGQTFTDWSFVLSGGDPADTTTCPNCNRKFYFTNQITIYEVI